VLGELLEQTFMTSMIKAQGNLLAFFDRPLSVVLGTLTILVWVGAVVGAILKAVRARRTAVV